MPEKKNKEVAPEETKATTPITAEGLDNVNPLTGEIDDLADINVGENEPSLNSIRFATPEEIKAMPKVNAEFVHDELVSKATGVTRHSYYANLIFDSATELKIPLSSQEYGIIVTTHRKLARMVPQYRQAVPVRIIGTRWEDGNVSYRLEVVLCDKVRKMVQLKYDDEFLTLIQMRWELDVLQQYKPIIRDAAKKE